MPLTFHLRLRQSSAPAEKSTFFKTAVTLSIFILFEPGFFHYPRDTLRFLNCPRTAKLDENWQSYGSLKSGKIFGRAGAELWKGREGGSSAPAEKSTFFKTAITLSIFILFEPGFFHYPRDTLRFLNCPRTAKLDENWQSYGSLKSGKIFGRAGAELCGSTEKGEKEGPPFLVGEWPSHSPIASFDHKMIIFMLIRHFSTF